MKKLFISVSIFFSVSCIAQKQKTEKISLADEIRRNFQYDSLSSLSCINTPTGIYALMFKVDRKGKSWGFQSSNDSLFYLNTLFINAIKKSIPATLEKKIRKGVYLQLIYFSNIVSCNPYRSINNSLMVLFPDTSIMIHNNYDKEIARLLSEQLISIENSLLNMQNSNLQGEKIIYLVPALINNENPNTKKNNPGFKNDIKPNSITKEEMEAMIQAAKMKKINN